VIGNGTHQNEGDTGLENHPQLLPRIIVFVKNELDFRGRLSVYDARF
jgi:hypothetical protein